MSIHTMDNLDLFSPGEASTQQHEEESLSTQQPQLGGLSDAQEMVLAILPIPSAILSILGSVCIISMSLSTKKKWTVYTRLLIGMSMCDIVSSMTLAVAAFLRPRDYTDHHHRIWTFGSEATCSAIGTLTQFSYSGLFYNSMLSLYFLLSTRFKLKNETIAKWFEPIMHFLSLGFPFVTAIVGAFLGVYSTTTTELGCWVNDYPRGCIGDECMSITIGWYYFGMPFLLSFAIIGISNLSILLFVRKKTRFNPKSAREEEPSRRPHNKHSLMDDDNLGDGTEQGNTTIPDAGSFTFRSSSNISSSSNGPNDSFRSLPSLPFSFVIDKRQESTTRVAVGTNNERITDAWHQQQKRLWLVVSQARLFVASFVFTAGWLGLLRIIESMAETPEDELKMVSKVYPLMVLNAFFSLLQGFLNMLVFLRPKYYLKRKSTRIETRFGVLKRCIMGADNVEAIIIRPRVYPKPIEPPEEEEFTNHENEPKTTTQINTDVSHHLRSSSVASLQVIGELSPGRGIIHVPTTSVTISG